MISLSGAKSCGLWHKVRSSLHCKVNMEHCMSAETVLRLLKINHCGLGDKVQRWTTMGRWVYRFSDEILCGIIDPKRVNQEMRKFYKRRYLYWGSTILSYYSHCPNKDHSLAYSLLRESALAYRFEQLRPNDCNGCSGCEGASSAAEQS